MPKPSIKDCQELVGQMFAEICPNIKEKDLSSFIEDWKVIKELKRKEVLISIGAKDYYVYFVVEGSLRIYYPGKQTDHVFGFGYPNTFLVEIHTHFKDEPSKFEVEALKSCVLIGIHKNDFETAMERIPELKKFWQQATVDAMFARIDREIDLITESPKDRLERVQKRSPHLFQLIPAKHIASYLRMTPETLSRLNKS